MDSGFGLKKFEFRCSLAWLLFRSGFPRQRIIPQLFVLLYNFFLFYNNWDLSTTIFHVLFAMLNISHCLFVIPHRRFPVWTGVSPHGPKCFVFKELRQKTMLLVFRMYLHFRSNGEWFLHFSIQRCNPRVRHSEIFVAEFDDSIPKNFPPANLPGG